MYHAIGRVRPDPNRLCVSPERFASQMLYLKSRGLRGASVRELLSVDNDALSRRLVGLTFDDGYENFAQFALPVLEGLGFSATLFAVAGMLGEHNAWDEEPRMGLLDTGGLRAVASQGIEIGSHGMSHKRVAGLPPERLRHEVVESKVLLSEILGEQVEGFCYPYGSLDEAAVRAVCEAGYSYACACNLRVEGSVYDMPRPPVWEMDRGPLLSAKLRLHPGYSNLLSRITGG